MKEEITLPFGVVLGTELMPPFTGVAKPLWDAPDVALLKTFILITAAALNASRRELFYLITLCFSRWFPILVILC